MLNMIVLLPVTMKSDIIYEAKVNGYYFVYDKKGFISVYDEMPAENKTVNCLYSSKVDCKSKRDFEIEAIYASSKINDM